MRLINARDHTIREFVNGCDEIPPYAILSHCWGHNGDEVSYHDMISQTSETTAKPGFQKLAGACLVAVKCFKLDWVWIDTCCIDKSNSAELTESINSMFSWYRDAKVCLVHMNDVHSSDLAADPAPFLKSRWFTRGWTLQELIAPSDVEFWTSDWQSIGRRKFLSPHIKKATGIDFSSPEFGSGGLGRSLSSVSVAQKMSWAANRQTSNVEDMAYSLLGLFDIHMPLIYGEGWNAFARLQEEIMKKTDDQSIFAWGYGSRSAPDYWKSPRLLAKSPADFSGCGNIVPSRMDNQLPSFTVGPSGLSFKSPLLHAGARTPGLWYLPLQCRAKDDFFDIMAIPVSQVGRKFGLKGTEGDTTVPFCRSAGPVLRVPRTVWQDGQLTSISVINDPQTLSACTTPSNRPYMEGSVVFRRLPLNYALDEEWMVNPDAKTRSPTNLRGTILPDMWPAPRSGARVNPLIIRFTSTVESSDQRRKGFFFVICQQPKRMPNGGRGVLCSAGILAFSAPFEMVSFDDLRKASRYLNRSKFSFNISVEQFEGSSIFAVDIWRTRHGDRRVVDMLKGLGLRQTPPEDGADSGSDYWSDDGSGEDETNEDEGTNYSNFHHEQRVAAGNSEADTDGHGI